MPLNTEQFASAEIQSLTNNTYYIIADKAGALTKRDINMQF